MKYKVNLEYKGFYLQFIPYVVIVEAENTEEARNKAMKAMKAINKNYIVRITSINVMTVKDEVKIIARRLGVMFMYVFMIFWFLVTIVLLSVTVVIVISYAIS